MPDSTFTFRVDESLKGAFAKVAAAEDRTAAQLLRALMRQTVEQEQNRHAHDEWFHHEVAQALAEADDEAVTRLSHDEVRSSWHQQRAELERRRAAGRPA